MSVTVSSVTPSPSRAVYQGRWGFYNMSFDEFLRFKEAHKLFFRAYREYRAFLRWERKDPDNRVRWIYKYNEAGQKVGKEKGEKLPCPVHPAFMATRFRSSKNLYKLILTEYQYARHPKATKEEVRAPVLPSNFWEMVEELRAYYNK